MTVKPDLIWECNEVGQIIQSKGCQGNLDDEKREEENIRGKEAVEENQEEGLSSFKFVAAVAACLQTSYTSTCDFSTIVAMSGILQFIVPVQAETCVFTDMRVVAGYLNKHKMKV